MDFSAGFWELVLFKADLRGAFSSRHAFDGTDKKNHEKNAYVD
jgi:hypothetical protein